MLLHIFQIPADLFRCIKEFFKGKLLFCIVSPVLQLGPSQKFLTETIAKGR